MQTTSLQSSVRVYAVLIHPNLTNVVDEFELVWLYSTRSFSGVNIEYTVLVYYEYLTNPNDKLY